MFLANDRKHVQRHNDVFTRQVLSALSSTQRGVNLQNRAHMAGVHHRKERHVVLAANRTTAVVHTSCCDKFKLQKKGHGQQEHKASLTSWQDLRTPSAYTRTRERQKSEPEVEFVRVGCVVQLPWYKLPGRVTRRHQQTYVE